MGTEIEGKVYIPGYFNMAGSSVNSNGNVLPYYEEGKSSLHLIDKFTIVSATGSVHYDKEMLKRTMLVHEATFRKQVFELHRLYRIQKDLMAQFQGEEFNGYPRYTNTLQSRSYASPGDVNGASRTGTPISGHDLKQSSTDFMNETSSQYSVNGASLRCSNVRSRKKMLDLQRLADVYGDDDDNVEILEGKPLKRLAGTNGSVHGGNVNLNIGNSMSKHVEKNWVTDVQPRHNSTVYILNKPLKEASNMKIPDFLGVGISSLHKQDHLPQGVNLNFPALQGNSREKCAGKVSESRFFCANKELRHINSFGQRKDDPKVSMALLQHKQNYTNSSAGHYLSSDSTSNHLNAAEPPLFNDALNSLWQSNNTSYLTRVIIVFHWVLQIHRIIIHSRFLESCNIRNLPQARITSRI